MNSTLSRLRRSHVVILSTLIAALTLASPATASAADPGPVDCALTSTVYWDGGGGNNSWLNGYNWSGDMVPGPSDSVCISEGSNGGLVIVYDGGNTAINSLTTNVGIQVQGGRLEMSNLHVANSAWVNATSWYNSGHIKINNTAYVQQGAILESRAYGVIEGSFILTGAGTMLWSAGGQLSNDGILSVGPDSTLRIKGSVHLPTARHIEVHGTLAMGDTARADGEGPTGTTPAINGSGSIHVSPGGELVHDNGVGQAYLSARLDNDGEVKEITDSLRLDGTDAVGDNDEGTFDIHPDKSIAIGDGRQRLGGALVEGGGVMFASCPYNCGRVSIDGQLSIAPGSTFRLSGGSVNGTGSIWGGGTFQWAGGDFDAGTQLTITSGSTLRQTGPVGISGGTTLTIDGDYVMDGDVSLGGNAGRMHVTETGKLSKTSGTGWSGGDFGLDNDGLVTVASGSLFLYSADAIGVEDTGSFDTAQGATILLGAGHQRLRDAALTGNGTFELACPYNCGAATFSGNLDISENAKLRLDGGTAYGDQLTVDGIGTVEFSGGAFDAGVSSVFDEGLRMRVVESGGNLYGNLDLDANTTWVNGHLAMHGAATLDHRGEMEIVGGGQLGSSGDATIRTLDGSVINKQGSTESFYITSDFYNNGIVRSRQGTIRIDGSSPADGTRDSGSYIMDANAVISLGNGPTRLFGNVSLEGGGTFDINCPYNCGTLNLGGNVFITKNATLRLQSGGWITGTGSLIGEGTFLWDDGGMSNNGTLALGSDMTMRVQGGGQSVDGDRVIVNAGTIILGNPVDPVTGPIEHHHATLTGGGKIINNGLILKENGSYGAITPSVDNDGTIRATYGTLRLDGTDPVGQTDSGAIDVTPGAVVNIGNGNTERWDGMTLSGGGIVYIACPSYCGTVVADGTTDIQADTTLSLSSGTLKGTGTLTGAGELRLSGGWIDGNANLVSDTNIRVTGTGSNLRGGSTLTNTGTMRMGDFPKVPNPDVPGAFLSGANSDIHGGGTIVNTGSIIKDNGANSHFGVVFENDGLLSAEIGNITMGYNDPAGATDNGEFRTAAGATISAGDNVATRLGDGTRITGPGAFVGSCPYYCSFVEITGEVEIAEGSTLRMRDSATLSGNGTLKGAGMFAWDGGTINGDLTLTGTTRVAGDHHDINGGRTVTNTGTMLLGRSGGGTVINGGGRLYNTGTIKKDIGGDVNIGAILDNDGLVENAVSNMWFNRMINETEVAAGYVSSGEFKVAPGTYIGPGSNVHMYLDGATISGGGTLYTHCPYYCTFLVLAGTTTLEDGSTIQMDSYGGLSGTVNLAGNGTFNWTGWGEGFGSAGAPVTIGEGVTFKTNMDRNVGSRAITNSGTLQLGGNLAGGSLNNTATGVVSNTTAATISSALTNTGTIQVSGGVALNVANPSTSTLEAGHLKTGIYKVPAGSTLDLPETVTRSSATLELTGSTPDIASNLAQNDGTLRLLGDRTFTRSGNFANAGAVDLGGSSVLTVNGDYSQSAGSTTVGADATLNITGAMNVTGGPVTATGTLNVPTIASSAPVNVNGDLDADLTVQGELSGSGTIDGDVTVDGGTLSPGNSPGTLNVTGDLTMDADTTTVMEIDGAEQALRDLINVTGTLTVDGTLDLRTGAAFDPPYVDAYDMLVAGTLAGQFDTVVEAPELAGVKHYAVTYSATRVNAAVTETEAPTVATDVASSHGAAPTKDTTIEATWSAASDGVGSGLAGYRYSFSQSQTLSVDEQAAMTALPASATSVTSSALADGTWYFHLRSVDVERNVGTVVTAGPFTVDTVSPQIALGGGPAEGSSTKLTSATFTVITEAEATLTCSLDGGDLDCDGAISDLGDGLHVFRVVAVDAAGNEAVVTRSWTVDTAAPSLTVSALSGAVASQTATLTATTDAGAALRCALDTDTFTACPSPLTFTGLSQGAHTLKVKAVDAAGNETVEQVRTWTVDTVGPVVTIDSGPAEGSSTESATVSFGFSAAEAGATLRCAVDGAALSACTSPMSVTVSGYSAHTFTVRAADSLGNLGTAVTRTWTLKAPDVVPPPSTGGGGGTTPPPVVTPPVALPTVGSAKADNFVGDALANVFNGLAGNDIFKGNGGDDKFIGGAGNDKGSGDAGNDTLSGDAGTDTLSGGAGNDKLNGGKDKDKLNGDAGNDTIDANDKKPGDVVNGGAGKDTCIVNKGDVVKACEKIVRK